MTAWVGGVCEVVRLHPIMRTEWRLKWEESHLLELSSPAWACEFLVCLLSAYKHGTGGLVIETGPLLPSLLSHCCSSVDVTTKDSVLDCHTVSINPLLGDPFPWLVILFELLMNKEKLD